MKELLEMLTEFNSASILVRLILAVIAGGIIGMERGKHGSAAGLRTHILVCIGATMTALTGIFVYETLGISGDVLRLAAQVISGIGFLGAGMIIVKNTNTITGLTTAAGMWATAAIGIAVGFGFYFGALIATVACVFTAAFLSRLDKRHKQATHIYVEICVNKNINEILDKIRESLDPDAIIEAIPPKSNVPNTVGIYVTVSNIKTIDQIKEQISELEGIVFWVME